jgi:mRNA export factor
MASFGATLTAQPVDAPVISPPVDTVSSLNFSPAQGSNLLVSTSWSNQVQCWDTAIQGNTCASQPKAETKHELPLDASWTFDGSKVITCGCDKTVKLWDLATNQQRQIGQHDAPVRAVCALHPSFGSIVATGALLPFLQCKKL